jgi:hypothetical protein
LSAAASVSTTAVADLVLVRYAISKSTPKKVREDVGQLLDTELSAADFDKIRNDLVSASFLTKGPRNTFTVTDEGRKRALHFLGLAELPPKTNWGTVVAKHLFPMAAGLSASAAAKLDNGDKLAALVLKRKYGLPGEAGSSVNQVLEAVVCKELGFPEETKLSGLVMTVLSKLLGSRERLTKKQLAEQLPLFETGLVGASAAAVRRKLLRDWMVGRAHSPPPALPPFAESFDLGAFAATVQAMACMSPSQDRFHDNKVFIAALWRASQLEPNFPRLNLPEFKLRVVEANSQHLLHLSRADLVQAMDPQLVAESETVYLNATFHFVLLEAPR